MRIFRLVVVLHGNAVGGGSIAYGNTLMVPPDHVWNQSTWAAKASSFLPPFRKQTIASAGQPLRRADFPTTSISEILFNIPTTADWMGGAGMARTRGRGVRQQEPGLWIH